MEKSEDGRHCAGLGDQRGIGIEGTIWQRWSKRRDAGKDLGDGKETGIRWEEKTRPDRGTFHGKERPRQEHWHPLCGSFFDENTFYANLYRELLEEGIVPRQEWRWEDLGADGLFIPFELPEQLPMAFVCSCGEVALRLIDFLKGGANTPNNHSRKLILQESA